MLTTEFQRARKCESGACVEVAWNPNATSTNGIRAWQEPSGDWHLTGTEPGSPVLTYTRDEWHVFTNGAKVGDFDLPGWRS